MAHLTLSYNAPPQVFEALRDGTSRQEGRWIRAKCPFCDPEGRKGRSMAIGEKGWLCHRCHAEEHEHDDRMKIHLQFRSNGSPAADERRRREWAIQLVEQSSSIHAGDPIDRYLREHRKLVPIEAEWPGELRRAYLKHPDTKRNYTVMLGIVRDRAGMIMAVHRTYLMDDGTRADKAEVPDAWRVANAKLTLGPLRGGHALRLGHDPKADSIGVAEGIETCLALRMRLRLPVWSGLNANGVADMAIPPEILRVVIGPDIGDKDSVGIRKAVKLQQRLLLEAKRTQVRRVVQLLPPPRGDDWAAWAEQLAQVA